MGKAFGERLQVLRRNRHLTPALLGSSELPAREIFLLETGQCEPHPGAVRLLAQRLAATAQAPRIFCELSAAQAWDERDYRAARGFAHQGAAAAQSADDPAGWWELSYLAAACLRWLHEYPRCIVEADLLAQHPLAVEGQPLRPRAQTLLAAACQGAGQLADAVVHARLALELGLSGRDPAHLIEAYQVFIAALSESGLQEEAWGHCRTLFVPLLEACTDRQRAGKGFWAVGNVAFRRGDTANGLQLHAKAASLLAPTVDLAAWAAFNRASAAMRLAEGIHDAATGRCLARAETALAVVGGTEEDSLGNLHNRGRWLQLSGNHPLAVDVLGAVHARHGLLPLQSTGEVALHLGLSLAALGRTMQAVRVLEESAAAYSHAGAPDRAGHAARLSAQVRTGNPVGLTDRTRPW